MQVKSLMLENVRGFVGRHEIDFGEERISVFLGVNGAGKSTVIEAVAACLQQISYSFNNTDKVNLLNRKEDISIGHNSSFATMQVALDKEELEIGAEITNSFADGRQGSLSLNTSTHNWFKLAFGPGSNLPILCYYQTKQHIRDGETQIGSLSKDHGRWGAYTNALNAAIHFDELIGWYKDLVNVQNAEIFKRKDFDYRNPAILAIDKGLSVFLSSLEGTEYEVPEITLDAEDLRQVFTYRKGKTNLAFNQLSSGEKLVVGLTMDIIYRCITANPHLPDPLISPGVVLIDEIELHLHPRWQANIIKALTATFPNIQFIVTTHSPLVVNQLQNEQLFLLTKEGIVPGRDLQETYGMDANTVISEVMGAPARPTEIKKRFSEIENLLDEPTTDNLEQARELLRQLTDTISPNDAELLSLKTLFNFEMSEVDQ